MEPSRFWLRRDDDDRTRQVVYDPVRLDRYSDRQKRAILKVMARGKTASHRDIREAARRARSRPRSEMWVAVALALSVLAVLAILFAGRTPGPGGAGAVDTAIAAEAGSGTAGESGPGELSRAMDDADRAWLKEVGAGTVASAHDGSDVLTLPQSGPAGLPRAADSRSDRHR